MDEQTRRAKEQMKSLPRKEKLKNYWYYYKIHSIVAVICLIVLSVSLVKCATRIDYDLNVSMYTIKLVDENCTAKLVDMIKAECADINGDGAVNVDLSSNVADITSDNPSEMTYMMYQKLMAEFASNARAAYVMDEAYKDYIMENYGYPEESLIEISAVSEVREFLNLSEEDTLYWVPAFDRGDGGDESDRFENAKKVTEFFETKRES